MPIRIPTFTLCLIFAGCSTPLGLQDLAGLAPWKRLPEGNGITYLAKARGGRKRVLTFAALVQYSDDQALGKIVKEFGLVAAKAEHDEAVSLFEVDNEQLMLITVNLRCEYPQIQDWYSCVLWVDSENKRAAIRRMWWW